MVSQNSLEGQGGTEEVVQEDGNRINNRKKIIQSWFQKGDPPSFTEATGFQVSARCLNLPHGVVESIPRVIWFQRKPCLEFEYLSYKSTTGAESVWNSQYGNAQWNRRFACGGDTQSCHIWMNAGYLHHPGVWKRAVCRGYSYALGSSVTVFRWWEAHVLVSLVPLTKTCLDS